jgi:dTDP-4-amino-4,6-dideoxygalactose transaminase
MWKVQLFKLNYDQRETQAVADVVNSGWITMGEKTLEFENQFSQYLGKDVRAAALSSGTAALHLALLALGVGPGDEVIVPGLTFVADINVVKMVGATPVLADSVSTDDWNISPAAIAEVITAKTKAVIAVHFAGFPCAMDEIRAVLDDRRNKTGQEIFLIEDAAHAPGAEYRGQKCGTIGDIGCFSFFTNKNLSVGEGGMATTRSEALDQKLRHLRSHGMTSLTLDRHKGRSISYDVVAPGLNYRIDEMRAAIGLVQLAKLEEANEQRQKLFQHYCSALASVPEVTVPFLGFENVLPSFHIFPVLLPKGCDRPAVIASMKGEGVQTSIHYPGFQNFTAFRNEGLADTPVAAEIAERELTLPLYPTMELDQVDLVVDALKRALAKG